MSPERSERRPQKRTPPAPAQSGSTAKRKTVRESRSAYRASPNPASEKLVDLTQLVNEVAELSQRLQVVEVQLNRLRASQLRSSKDRRTIEDLAWLKTAEAAFEFWENPEDAIYDTL